MAKLSAAERDEVRDEIQIYFSHQRHEQSWSTSQLETDIGNTDDFADDVVEIAGEYEASLTAAGQGETTNVQRILYIGVLEQRVVEEPGSAVALSAASRDEGKLRAEDYLVVNRVQTNWGSKDWDTDADNTDDYLRNTTEATSGTSSHKDNLTLKGQSQTLATRRILLWYVMKKRREVF